jgi:hypothetical protein
MKNIIKFIPITKNVELFGQSPVPSNTTIPKWYKQISPFANKDKELKFPTERLAPNVTVKKCMPFFDALTTGYMFVLDDDVFVDEDNGQPIIRWRSDETIVTSHTPDQFDGFIIPEEYHHLIAKWHNDWEIKVPKGYSVYFTHPSNRFDLPFHTLSGIVDCDKYEIGVHFPFILKKGFKGIIEKGTPVCQLIIVKREKWKSIKEKFNEESVYIKHRKFNSSFSGAYKNFYREKKYYD